MRYYRVVVEPKSLGDFKVAKVPDTVVCEDEEERKRRYYEICEEIVEQIKRHIDNIGEVYIEEISDEDDQK